MAGLIRKHPSVKKLCPRSGWCKKFFSLIWKFWWDHASSRTQHFSYIGKKMADTHTIHPALEFDSFSGFFYLFFFFFFLLGHHLACSVFFWRSSRVEMFTHLAKTLVVLVFKFTSKPRNVFLSMLARVCPAANRLTVISQTRTEKEKGKCRRGRGGRGGREGE